MRTENLENEIRQRYWQEGFSIHDLMEHYGLMSEEVLAILLSEIEKWDF